MCVQDCTCMHYWTYLKKRVRPAFCIFGSTSAHVSLMSVTWRGVSSGTSSFFAVDSLILPAVCSTAVQECNLMMKQHEERKYVHATYVLGFRRQRQCTPPLVVLCCKHYHVSHCCNVNSSYVLQHTATHCKPYHFSHLEKKITFRYHLYISGDQE